jgi:hypothetical protein
MRTLKDMPRICKITPKGKGKQYAKYAKRVQACFLETAFGQHNKVGNTFWYTQGPASGRHNEVGPGPT